MATVTQTANFIYIYDDALTGPDRRSAIARANALAKTCEDDLAKLQSMFGFGPPNPPGSMFGSDNPITITISVDPTGKSLGSNRGFDLGGRTSITINPFTQLSRMLRNINSGDGEARAVFVAEMSEVFMDFRNKQTPETTTWVAKYSHGEALSIVCAALLHPEGYYPNLGPRIWNWLNFRGIDHYRFTAVRPNWVDQNGPSDSDPVAYGCGIVFIYYMLTQLHHPIQDIITKAGTNLGETYQNLTGHTDGWTSVNDLLNVYFPANIVAVYNPINDNLFPLMRTRRVTAPSRPRP